MKRIRIAAGLVVLFAGTLPAFSMTALKSTTSLNVRTGPGTGYTVMGLVPAGHVYVGIAKSGDWWKVNYDGRTGWVCCADKSRQFPLGDGCIFRPGYGHRLGKQHGRNVRSFRSVFCRIGTERKE